MSKRSASNGREGGIRTPGTLSGTTDFESVTFGHSATSPKNWDREAAVSQMASFDCKGSFKIGVSCELLAGPLGQRVFAKVSESAR